VTTLVPVTPGFLESVWIVVRPFAERAAKHGRGLWTPESFYRGVSRGDAQLWLAADGGRVRSALATEIVASPDSKVFRVLWFSGSRDDVHHFRRIRDWAAEQGCTTLIYEGRKGWARMRPTAKVVGMIYQEEI